MKRILIIVAFLFVALCDLKSQTLTQVKTFVGDSIKSGTNKITGNTLNYAFNGVINYLPDVVQDTAFVSVKQHGYTRFQRKDSTAYVYDTIGYKRWRKYVYASVIGGGLSDGNKGDVTVGGSGSSITINNLAVTNAKIQDVSWSKVLSKPTTVSGYGITDAATISRLTDTAAAIRTDLNGKLSASDTANKWATSIFRRNDSVFVYKGGVPTFMYKDSVGSGGGSVSSSFPIKTTGSTITLFPKIRQPQAVTYTTPYSPTFQWAKTSSSNRPHWYDGTVLAYKSDTLFSIAGWYDNGSGIWRTDSVYYSVPPYSSWSLFPVRFPIATHTIAYTYNKARGYWVFAGSDSYATSTQNKTVIITYDFRTYITKTTNYGGSARILSSLWSDDEGSLYWGFGQSSLDSANHLDDIWKSNDDGATWTQAASNITVNGLSLGGNTVNSVKYRNGSVYAIAMGGKYDNNSSARTYSKRNFKASIDDLTKWWEIDSLPLATGRQYPSIEVHNGWIWAVNGGDNGGNLRNVHYLDFADKWHPYNAFLGYNPSDLNFSPSHAQGIVSNNDKLFLSDGNGTNETYILQRSNSEFTEGGKNIVSNVWVGNAGYTAKVGINLPDSNYITSGVSLDVRGKARVESDDFDVLSISTNTVTNNFSAIKFNGGGTGYSLGVGGLTGPYANGFGVYQSGTNYFPLWLNPNGHLLVNNNSGSIPTNVSPLQVIGLQRSTASVNAYVKVDTTTGDFYYDTTGTVGGGGGSGSPGGSNTQIQFNSSGTFGASASLTWDGSDFYASSIKTDKIKASTAPLAFRNQADNADVVLMYDGGLRVNNFLGINTASTVSSEVLHAAGAAVFDGFMQAYYGTYKSAYPSTTWYSTDASISTDRHSFGFAVARPATEGIWTWSSFNDDGSERVRIAEIAHDGLFSHKTNVQFLGNIELSGLTGAGSATQLLGVGADSLMRKITVSSGLTFSGNVLSMNSSVLNEVNNNYYNTYTFSGDGSTKDFDVTTSSNPTWVNVTPTSADASGISYWVEKGTNKFAIHFASAPPSGTNNVKFDVHFRL